MQTLLRSGWWNKQWTRCWIVGLIGWSLVGSGVVAQPLTITLNGQAIPQSDWLSASVIHLPAREKSLVIDIRCRQHQRTFEYRLWQDRSVEWRLFHDQVTIYYDNLSGSEYIFQVRELNRNLVVERRVFVENAIWQSWWFIPSLFLYMVLAVSIVVYLFFRYRYRQQVKLLNVRENIARDLHDDMGSYLGSISILSQSVLNVAQKDPQHARLLVDKIGETARQVMDSMSDIIWSVNPDNDSMAQVVVRMRDVATDLLGAQDISLHVDIDEAVQHVHLPLEQRRDFFLIYKEALTNIAKYASATHVWVRLQRNGTALLLTVQDDGVGFDTHQTVGRNPLGGNGLKNMRARAEKTGGTLAIQSTPGQGAVLTLQISVA